MNTLDTKFCEMKHFHFSNKQIVKGYITIGRILTPKFYLKVGWEFITTFFVYSPGINNYLRDVISSIRAKWIVLSCNEQENIIAALTHLNKHGKIDKALSKD